MDATYLSQLENGHWGIRWARVKRVLRTLDLYLSDLAESTRDTRTDAASRLRALPPCPASQHFAPEHPPDMAQPCELRIPSQRIQPMGDTGLEPVTSALSRRRSPS